MGRFLTLFLILTLSHLVGAQETTVFPTLSGKQIWVLPENLDSSLLEKRQEVLEIIFTEKNRAPRESTGDIVKSLRQNSEVSLVCVEKAAADCMETLIRYPKLQKKLKSFVSINGKIYGAEYAEKTPKPFKGIAYIQAQKLPVLTTLKFIFEELKAWWNTSLNQVYAMSPSYRKTYMEENGTQIQGLSRQVPIYWVDETPRQYGALPFGQPLVIR